MLDSAHACTCSNMKYDGGVCNENISEDNIMKDVRQSIAPSIVLEFLLFYVLMWYHWDTLSCPKRSHIKCHAWEVPLCKSHDVRVLLTGSELDRCRYSWLPLKSKGPFTRSWCIHARNHNIMDDATLIRSVLAQKPFDMIVLRRPVSACKERRK